MVKSDFFEQNKRENIRKSKTFRKTLIKKTPKSTENAYRGRVIEVKPKFYIVEDCSTLGKTYSCFAAGAIATPHQFSNLIACGDYVKFILEENSNQNEINGTIIEVEERKTKFSRRDPANPNREHVIAANMTHLLVFMSVLEPDLNFRLIDRMLVAAELGKLEPIICINKIDLVNYDEISDLFDPYRKLKIPFFPISVAENIGIDELNQFLAGKDTVVAGMSGVGKSSFLNKILGRPVQKVAEVSTWSGKGRHTTSIVCRFPLPNGGFLTDTPGLREFALWDLEKDELCLLFPDFRKYINDCRYPACTHTHEPDCSVKRAVEKNKISFERYQSYLQIYDSLD